MANKLVCMTVRKCYSATE